MGEYINCMVDFETGIKVRSFKFQSQLFMSADPQPFKVIPSLKIIHTKDFTFVLNQSAVTALRKFADTLFSHLEKSGLDCREISFNFQKGIRQFTEAKKIELTAMRNFVYMRGKEKVCVGEYMPLWDERVALQPRHFVKGLKGKELSAVVGTISAYVKRLRNKEQARQRKIAAKKGIPTKK